ncbi:MAG: NADPH:quinone oxidoreductase family protein [Rhodospirillaceae bacterium]|nr:NADPH:quinone oxidoreductase family protein [Rhodospirillaceae bacterium]
MRAVVIREFNNPDAVNLEEVSNLIPGAHEVVVDACACSVNYTDWMSLDGSYQNIPGLPFTPGKDSCGIVSAIGSKVTRHKVGGRVIAHVNDAGLAEQVVCHEDMTFPIPDGLSFEDAAGIGLSYMTAWFAVMDRGQLQTGHNIIVTGASGGVGMAAVNIARAMGADTVFGAISNMEKADAVREAGADAVVDLSAGDLKNGIRDQVRAVTGGPLCNVAVEMIGGEAFEGSLRALQPEGRIVVCGFVSGKVPTARANYLLVKHIGLIGMTMAAPFAARSPKVAEAQAKLFDLAVEGKITPRISACYPLEDYLKAIHLLGERKIVGKAILTMGRREKG